MAGPLSEKTPQTREFPSGNQTLKAAVAIPPVFDFYSTPHRFSGLGVEILCRLLQENHATVELFDFPGQRKKGAAVPLPPELDYLKPHLIANEDSRLSFFSQYQRFGPTIEDCARQIGKVSPDIVFIACFAFCYAKPALELSARIRDLLPRALIVLGGAGVSAYPEFFLRHPALDFALAGEAEVFIPAFLKALRSGTRDFSIVPNLYWKTGGRVETPLERRQTTADDITFVLKKTRTTRKGVYFSTALSRGCIKKCRFCSNFLCHGREFRVVPVDVIRARLADIILPPGDTDKNICINFEDDNLLLAPDYFLRVLGLFRQKFPGAVFLAENGLDYTRMTPELVEQLIVLGFRQFNLSIASTDDPILAEEHREATFPLYEQVIRILTARQIPSITYFICGFKKDTRKTIAADIAFLAKQPTRIGISLFYPVPGIFDFTDKTGFDGLSPTLCAGASAYPWNRSLSTTALVTAFRLCRFVNLLKSDKKSPEEIALLQKISDHRRLYTLIKIKSARRIIPVPGMDEALVDLFFETFQKS